MKACVSTIGCLIVAVFISGCATTPRHAPERWNCNFDSRQWQLGYQAATDSQAIREYVLPGQTVHNWTELVTSQYFARDVSPKALFEQFTLQVSRGCPSLRTSIIEESNDTIIFEWQHDGCQGRPPQHEIRRSSSSHTGVLGLAFVEKTSQLSREK